MKIFSGFLMTILVFVSVFGATTVSAQSNGYGGDPVQCTMIATPDTIGVGGATTLSWTLSENVVSAVLSGKNSNSWMQSVPLDGSWYISGIVDSRAYTLTVTGPEGQTATCDASVVVEAEVLTTPTCTMEAVPGLISPNGATTLVWNSSDNVVSAKLHPTGSMSWSQTVPIDGSWYISGIVDSRSYSLTVENSNGDEYTCDAPVVVSSGGSTGTAPSCTVTATPNSIAQGGGTTLVWESSDNVVSAKLSPENSTSYFATVTPDGSWYISGIVDDRGYSVNVRSADGQTAVCTALIDVVEGTI